MYKYTLYSNSMQVIRVRFKSAGFKYATRSFMLSQCSSLVTCLFY